MMSLRRTALIWMTLLLTAIGFISFGISYEYARLEAADFLDGQLRQIALNAGENLVETFPSIRKHDPEDEFIITMWNSSGKALRQTANSLPLPRQSRVGFATIHALGEDWRVYVAYDSNRFVQVAQRMSVRREMAETAAIQAGAPVLMIIPLAWLAIGWLLSRWLRSVTSLAQNIAGRGIENKERISVDGVPIEVRPLVEAMNLLTTRLQQALTQQKQFVADAAHELRTPLAALNIQVDNLRATARDDQAGVVTDLDNGVHRATALVQQLLQLARSDETTLRQPFEMLNVTELVIQAVADFQLIASAKGVDLGMAASDSAVLSGCAADLKMLFGNLIDNAIRYTPEGGCIDVSVRLEGGPMVVEILDTGCGIAEAELPRIFDRFFRAASNDVEGSGLGLSIAATVATQHGLAIDIANRTDRSGVRVRVTHAVGGASLTRP